MVQTSQKSRYHQKSIITRSVSGPARHTNLVSFLSVTESQLVTTFPSRLEFDLRA